MAIKCGINLNLNNLQGEITSKLSGFVNLSGTLGTPAGLATIKADLESSILSIKGKFQALIPEIPTVPQSLRDDLAALALLPAGGAAALAKIAQFGEDYLGLTDIKGFADINLNDLASSVFSVTGTFDPCSAVANIPNIIKNPVTGALEQLPAAQPDLGSTVIAKTIKEVQTIPNSFDTASINNALLSATDTIEKSLENLKNNVVPAMDAAIRKMPDGTQILEMQQDLIDRLKKRSTILQETPVSIPV
jgi:hypothetical protein